MKTADFLDLAATNLGSYVEEDFRRTGEWDDGSIQVVVQLKRIAAGVREALGNA